jgi:hypothetical protein
MSGARPSGSPSTSVQETWRSPTPPAPSDRPRVQTLAPLARHPRLWKPNRHLPRPSFPSRPRSFQNREIPCRTSALLQMSLTEFVAISGPSLSPKSFPTTRRTSWPFPLIYLAVNQCAGARPKHTCAITEFQPPLRAGTGRNRHLWPSHRVRHFVSCPVVDFISSKSHQSYTGDLTRAAATSPAVKTLDPQVSPSSLNLGRRIENQSPGLVHLSEPVPADLDRIDPFRSNDSQP